MDEYANDRLSLAQDKSEAFKQLVKEKIIIPMKDWGKTNRDIFNGSEDILVPHESHVDISNRRIVNGIELCDINYHGIKVNKVPADWLGPPSFEKEEEQDKAQWRKDRPVFSGVLNYFPNALKEVANCSRIGNEQHHPGEPLHWDKSKSKDEADALVRHLMDHHENPIDEDGIHHLAKTCWRALAMFERYLTDDF